MCVFYVSVGIHIHIVCMFGKCIMWYEYFIYEVYARNFECIFLAFDSSMPVVVCVLDWRGCFLR
jgi:hypothetical protein